MTDDERLLDQDILALLETSTPLVIQTLGTISFRLAKRGMDGDDLKEFAWTIQGRLNYLCSVGLVRAKSISLGPEGVIGFLAINVLDALAEIPDEIR